jgi:hypothetical protein
MKIHFTKNFAFAALACAFLFAGCKRDDVTAPSIVLNGNDPMQVVVGTTFTDPGVVATDDVDGDLTSDVVVSGTVNANLVGSYVLTYTATDVAGNAGTAIRNVNVVLTRDAALGSYATTSNCPTPYDFIASTTNFTAGSTASKILISPYYYNGGQLIVTIDGLDVTVDAGQAPAPLGDGVTGSGTYNAAANTLVMNYTYTPNGGSPVACSVTYTK